MSKEAVLSSSQKELESTAEEKDIWNTSKDNVHLLYTVYKIWFFCLQCLQIFDNGQYSVHKKQEHKNGHQIFNEND